MKKSLLAVAVATALPGIALAQSSVTLSGILKTGLSSYKLENGASGNGNATAWGDGSSRFIISGTEDIGGGLKGIFQIDTRFRVDNGAGGLTNGTYGGVSPSGNTWLGLAGDFGAVKIGNQDLYYYQGTDQYGARATALTAWNVSILSYINGQAIARGSRSQNTLRYESPNFNGFTAALAWSANPDGAEANPVDNAGKPKGNAYDIDLNYTTGPLSLGLAAWSQKKVGGTGATPATADQSAVRVFGGYDFGIFTASLAVDQSSLKPIGGDIKRTAISLPLTAPVGAGTALFTYTRAQDSEIGGVKSANTGASLITVGYDYPLSKRTSLGVSYAKLDNKANASYALFTGYALHDIPTPVAGQDTNQLYLGLRHAF
jgi:predicted porin